MLVDRTVAQWTSAGHGNSCLIEFSEERSEEIIRSTHLSCILIRYAELIYCSRIDPVGVLAYILDLCTQFFKDLDTDSDIADLGHVFYDTWFI